MLRIELEAEPNVEAICQMAKQNLGKVTKEGAWVYFKFPCSSFMDEFVREMNDEGLRCRVVCKDDNSCKLLL